MLIAERQLADADLVAPTPGIVLSRVRETGAIVNAGETVFILSLNSPVWVRTYVSSPTLAASGRAWRSSCALTRRVQTPSRDA